MPLACGAGGASAAAPSLSSDAPDTMAYCTAQDVIDAYSREQIAEVTGDPEGAEVNEGQVQRAVEDYGAQVEAHVRMQHPDDPFDATNEYLNSLNVEGAFLLLQKRTTGGMEENLQDAEERLDEVLLRIAQGELELLDDEDEAEAEGRPDLRASELTRARPRVFGRWSRQRYDEL